MSGRDIARATTPPDKNRLKIKSPKSIAAGIPAATSSMIHGFTKMGVTKTIKTESADEKTAPVETLDPAKAIEEANS